MLATITGTAGNDTLNGSETSDTISGLDGNDTINGLGGVDDLNGNTGRDRVSGGSGNDTVQGGADDDYIVMGDDGDDSVYGNKGNDGDFASTGVFFVSGGIGNDRVYGGDGNDVVRGGQGDDWVYGDDDPAGVQQNPVSTGNDWIAGDLGNDQLFGQGGADTFYFQPDTAGIVDTINDWNPAQGDRIDLALFDAQPGSPFAAGVITDFGSLVLTQVDSNTEITLPTAQKIVLKNTSATSVLPTHFLGKASIDRRGNDSLQANAAGEQLNGREGDDVVTGSVAADNLNGNTGRDWVIGGGGNDTVQGGADDDVYVMGDEGDDYVYGNRGNDGDMAQTGTYFVNGGIGNDHVYGGDGSDVVRGGQGDDWVYGDDDPSGVQQNPVATGNDWIAGDLGNDQLFGLGGADTFFFQPDGVGIMDTIHDWNPAQGDRIDLSLFDAQVGNPFATGVITDFGSLTLAQLGSDAEITLPTGQKIILKSTAIGTIQPSQFLGKASIDRRGNDVLQANAAGEQVSGREGDDIITGSAVSDNLNGNPGRDQVDGGAGADIVRGGKDDDIFVRGGDGDDWVYGDLGNDLDVNGNKGRDRVYGGPGNDVVRGGADDDYQVYGDDGNDTVYGDEGNDTEVNGNRGNDFVYGGNGNDIVRGGQDDDDVFGDAGDDKVYGDLGTNRLTGGTGRDTFVITAAINVQNTILDFERGSDRIDLTALADLTTYEQLVLQQEGSNTTIQLSPSNKLIIQGLLPNQLKSTDFVGPWSAHKSVYLWVPGLLHARITQDFAASGGANALTPTGQPVIKVAEYRINGFNPLANPGNLLPHKPFQLIDLRSVSVSQVTWQQSGSDTIVSLALGKVLRLVGVTASQVTLQNFLTAGQDEEAAIDAYLADWTDQSQIERTVVPPADRFYTEGRSVIYESTPTISNLVNNSILQTDLRATIIRLDVDGPQLQRVDQFNPANPLHKIDLTGMDAVDLRDLGIEQVGTSTLLHFPNGQSLILTDVLKNELTKSSFIGWAAPDAFTVFTPDAGLDAPVVRGFDPSLPGIRLNLSVFMQTPQYSELTFRAQGVDTLITFQHSQKSVLVTNVDPAKLTRNLLIGPEWSALERQETSSRQTEAETVRFSTLANSTPVDQLIGMVPDVTSPGQHGDAVVTRVLAPPRNTGNVVTNSLATRVGFGEIQSQIASYSRSAADQMVQFSQNHQTATTVAGGLLAGAEESLSRITAQDKFKQNIKLAKTVIKGSGKLLTVFGVTTDAIQDYNEAYARLISQGRSPEAAEDFAALSAFGKFSVKLSLTGGQVEAGARAGGALGFRLSNLLPPIPIVKIGVTAIGALGGGVAAAVASDKIFNELKARGLYEKYDADISRLAEAYDPVITGSEETVSFASIAFEDDLSDAERTAFEQLPVGGSMRVGNQLIVKERLENGIVAEKWDPDAIPETTGNPSNPIAFTPPEGLDLDGESGAYFRYSEGVYFKWDGNRWTPLPRGTDITSDPAYDSSRVSFADKAGATITSVASQFVFGLTSLVADSIDEWYTALTEEQPGGAPSGLTATASQAAGTFLADIVLNGDFDAALVRAKNAAINSQINRVIDSVQTQLTSTLGISNSATVASFVSETFNTPLFAGTFAVDLAKTIGEQMIRGEFDDSFASTVVTQSAIGFGVGQGVSFAVERLGGTMTNALAQGLGLGAKFFPVGFDPITVAASIIIQTVLNEAFSEEIAEVATFVGDVGEEIWDFVNDPINSIKDWFDDPKFSSINGTEGFDTLYQPSNARIRSDLLGGNDVMFGGDNWGIILAGLGDDIILQGSTIPGGGVPGNGVGELYGEEGADYIDGAGGNDELYGGGGADVLYGGMGDDTLAGGDASPARTYTRDTGIDEGDYINGGLGNDTMTGGTGRDTFAITPEANAHDIVTDFHSGEDWLDLSEFTTINDLSDVRIASSPEGAVVNLPNGQNVLLRNVNAATLIRAAFVFTQFGTAGNDILDGSDSVEIFNGLDGNDELRLGGGNDIANGNAGNDIITGGTGDDRLRGGRDNDNISGGEGDDVVWGDLGDDELNSNQGADRIEGGDGNDIVRGGRDDDTVLGGNGNDQLYGDLGFDVLIGGNGADTFFITNDPGSTDLITDWQSSENDRLQVTGFSSFPLTADDVVQVGYDTYLFLPNGQRVVVQFASADQVRTELKIDTNPVVVPTTTPVDQAPPSMTGVNPSLTVALGTTALTALSGAAFTDRDSPDFNAGRLTVTILSGSGTLALAPQSAEPAISFSGDQVLWNGFVVGTSTLSPDARTLSITWNENATPAVIEEILSTITVTNLGTTSGSITRVSVTFEDGDGGTSAPFTQTITLAPNHSPVVATKDFLIGENSLNGAFIGTIPATDLDAGQTKSFAITAGNTGDAFAIDPNTGVLSVNNSAALNYEAITQFTLTVTATDNGNPALSGSAAVRIFLRDVNEGPAIGGVPTNQTVNDSATISPFSAITVGDPDMQNMLAKATILNGVVRGDFAAASVAGWTRSVSGYNIVYSRYYNPQANIGSVVQAALRSFVFVPRNNAIKPSTIELTDIQIFINDGVANTTVTTRLTTTSVNNVPAIDGASNAVTVNDNATVNPFTALTVTDVDRQELLISVTILNGVVRGDFTSASTAGWAVRYVQGNNITYKRYFSPQANVGAAAQAAFRALVFQPRQNAINPGTTEATDFQVTVSDGVAPAVLGTGTRVTTTSVNNAPTIGGAVAGQTMNDNQTKAVFSTLTVTDLDTQAMNVIITIPNGVSRGDFTAGSATGWTRTVVGSDLRYNRYFNATANIGATVQTAIRALVFQPRTNVPIGTTETTGFTVFLNDGLANTNNSTTSVIATGVAPRTAPTIASETSMIAANDITTVVLPSLAKPSGNRLARLLKKPK